MHNIKAHIGEAWDLVLTARQIVRRIKEKKQPCLSQTEYERLCFLLEMAAKELEKVMDLQDGRDGGKIQEKVMEV